MKKLALLILAGLAWSQNTAKFPTRVPVNADFGVATDRAQTTLTGNITSSSTSIPVTSSSQFKAGSFGTVDNEIVAVCSIPDGNHLNVGVSSCPNVDGRGIDTANGGGAAASHNSGAVIQGRITAWPINQSAAEIQALATALWGSSLNVKNYGAKGDGSTDDTTAISNAITAALSVSYAFPPCVVFPAGTYVVTSTIQISSRNVCIMGVTPWSTFINSTISGAIFNLDTYSSSQAPPWSGVANQFTARNLTFENTSQLAASNTGSRVTTGIQSNGSGHLLIENVQFTGLKYGFVAPYGSDFDRFRVIWCNDDDVGVYLGPSSNQFSILEIEGAVNGETLVLDGAGQGGVHDSTFEDAMTADITVERSQPTRFGWNPASISSYDVDSTYLISNNWFETGAGFGGISTWQEYRRVLATATAGLTSYPRNIILEHNFLVLGNGGIAAKDGSTHSIVEMRSGKFWQIHDVVIAGDRRDAEVYSNGGNASAVQVSNIIIDDGYSTSVPIFSFTSGTANTAAFSYANIYNNKSGVIPGSCSEGDQFYYNTANANWYACGSGGTYQQLAQLDGTSHIPAALLPTGPAFSTLTINGDRTTVNAIDATIYAGNSGTNNGYWWFQNAGNPVHSLTLQGYDPTNTNRITLDPAGGPNSQGSIKLGSAQFTSMTYAQMTGAGAVDGTGPVYCSDCKGNLQSGHTTPDVCASGGTGEWAFHDLGAWYCPF